MPYASLGIALGKGVGWAIKREGSGSLSEKSCYPLRGLIRSTETLGQRYSLPPAWQHGFTFGWLIGWEYRCRRVRDSPWSVRPPAACSWVPDGAPPYCVELSPCLA